MAVFYDYLIDSLISFIRTLLARETKKGPFDFFQIRYADVVKWSPDISIVCLKLPH